MTAIKTATKINYSELPKALRMAASKDAVAKVLAGENPNTVAKAFGTTLALVLSWVKRHNEGTLGSHMTEEAQATPTDYRNLTPELRNSARKSAVAKIRAGETPLKVSRKFGTTELSVRRWVENDTKGVDTEQKRGRKVGSHVTAPYTGKKRGRKPKVQVMAEEAPVQHETCDGANI